MYAVHNGLVPFAAARDGTARLVLPNPLEKDISHWSSDPEHNARVVRHLFRRRQPAFCVQDVCDPSDERVIGQFRELMEALYPEPSPSRPEAAELRRGTDGRGGKPSPHAVAARTAGRTPVT